MSEMAPVRAAARLLQVPVKDPVEAGMVLAMKAEKKAEKEEQMYVALGSRERWAMATGRSHQASPCHPRQSMTGAALCHVRVPLPVPAPLPRRRQ
jgi:hypothetical protein